MSEHEHPEGATGDIHRHPPAISRKWKFATVFGNLALGGFELLTGNVRSLAVAADGLHNISDPVAYHMQCDDLLLHGANADKLTRRRKAVHWIIATTSAAIAVKAGGDLVHGSSHDVNDLSVYAAGISLLYNSGLFLRLRQGMRREHQEMETEAKCHDESDLQRHFLYVDIPSAALALGGVVVQKYGLQNAEQLAAMASGLLGAIAFRPTDANLNHGH